jgi:putative ABC transport system permease protein
MEDLRQIPGVLEVSNASKSLGSPALFSNVFTLPGRNRSKARFASFIVADENFVKANGIKIISGRDFSSADSARVLVNETFLKNIGLDSRHAPGAKLTDAQSRVWEIAGVMKDFNAGTLHREIEPFMLWINNKKDGLWGSLTVHSSTKSYRELLSRIESVWKKDIPGVPFEYAFLDEQVQKMYESDQTMTRIINAFTGIAILISCLGLFGLAAFSAEQRHKEIGIRKVLGASVPGVIVLLSGDFLKLVGIAFLIATPLSWWAMNRWLMDFAYHIPLSWWMFGLGGLTTTFIALATVSSQAFCAATVNPVRTLRSE